MLRPVDPVQMFGDVVAPAVGKVVGAVAGVEALHRPGRSPGLNRVQHRVMDTANCEGRELDTAARVEALGGLPQARESGLGSVRLLPARKAAEQATEDKEGEPAVVGEQRQRVGGDGIGSRGRHLDSLDREEYNSTVEAG